MKTLGIDCCNKPVIATLSDSKATIENGRYVLVAMDNKICTNCGSHIYGEKGNSKFYTKQEWDSWINSVFDDDLKLSRGLA